MKIMTLVGDSVLHRTVRDDPLLEALSIQEHFPEYTVDNLALGGLLGSRAVERCGAFPDQDPNRIKMIARG